MKKISVLAALVLVLFFLLTGSAGAVTIDEVGNPGSAYWATGARAIAAGARRGAPYNPPGVPVEDSYVIAIGNTVLSSPGNYRAAITTNTLPFFTYNQTYHFTLEYVINTSFPDETLFTITNYSPTPQSVGANFFYGDIYTIRLNYAGNRIPGTAGGEVEISNLTLNGTTMGAGAYDSGFTNDNSVYFRYSDGTPFTKNFTIAGDFVFTGDGGAANYPGFEIDLSAQPVPLPPAVLLLGSGLLGLGALGWRRKRG